MVFLSCGGFGFTVCACHKNEEATLRQLLIALDYMQCELQYRLTPLPELFHGAGIQAKGILREIFLRFARELECCLTPDVASCMAVAIAACTGLPPKTNANLRLLGDSLGRFDLDGQLMGLEALRQKCREDLQILTADKTIRLRSYQTLGLCAGAALVILFV